MRIFTRFLMNFFLFLGLSSGGLFGAPFDYIVNNEANNVSVIDVATNQLIATVDVGLSPRFLTILPDGSKVYVANSGSSNVSVIDVATNQVIATIDDVGDGPNGLSATIDGTRVYVANSTSNSLSVIDTATDQVIDTIDLPAGFVPSNIVMSPNGTTAYIASTGFNAVFPFNLATQQLGNEMPVDLDPFVLVITPDGKRGYSPSQAFDRVTVLNLTNNTVLTTVSTPDPFQVAVTPDSATAYVTNLTGFVTPIDVATNTAGTPINVGGLVTAISITPDGTKAYVAKAANTFAPVSIIPINLATRKLGKAIPTNGVFAFSSAMTPPAPTVTSITPTFGPESGGTTVTITGTNFTGATQVFFGTTAAASFTVNSDSSITAVSPPGTGTVHVTVVTFLGTSATSPADRFAYIAPPSVTSISPTTGPTTGGTTVTIRGTHFTGATQVFFGATPAASFVVNSDRSITAVSPAGTGTVDVTVVTPFGTSATTPADQFTYVGALPIITSINPTSGPTTGGTTVTITGANFTGAIQVLFGGLPATRFVVNPDGSITAVSPAGTGIVDVRVITPFGISAITPADRFTYIVPLPFPPRNAHGHQVVNRFAMQADYVNILTWKDPQAGPTPVEYRIYRDAGLHELIATIAVDQELKFKDHNRKKGKTYTYFIVSVDALGLFSEPAVVTVHPRH